MQDVKDTDVTVHVEAYDKKPPVKEIKGKKQNKPTGIETEKRQRKDQRKKARQLKVTRDNKAYVYMGPNVPGGLLFTGSVYKGIPEHLKDTFEKLPEIKDLFVEVHALPGFKEDLKDQGSEAYRLYQHVESLIREGALKNGI